MGVYVSIEAGGTKFICAYGDSPGQLHDRVRIETRDPEETMGEVSEYLSQVSRKYQIDAIGLACFGPLDLDESSSTYGSITHTPKLAWKHFNIVDCIKKKYDVPIGFDTDVNAAALGEQQWGSGRGLDNVVYMTIGTGIGLGAVVEGRLLHGAMHAEAGHMSIFQDVSVDSFGGVCPYHGACLEGLASGPAIKERWGVCSALDLPVDHVAWELEADYLARAMTNVTLCFSPQRIILGGGVMRQPGLIDKVQRKTQSLINGYIKNEACDNWQRFIVAPDFGDDAGIVGAFALAMNVNN